MTGTPWHGDCCTGSGCGVACRTRRLPAKRIGLAQNPDPSAVFHHVSKPRDVARRSICLTTTALSIPAGSPGDHGMKNSGPLNVLPSVAGVRIALQVVD